MSLPDLPVRFRAGFVDRPWPTKPLWDEIVSPEYIPVTVAPEYYGEGRVLELLDRNHIRINDVSKSGVAYRRFTPVVGTVY